MVAQLERMHESVLSTLRRDGDTLTHKIAENRHRQFSSSKILASGESKKVCLRFRPKV
jgi:hypothetical protein